MKCPKCGGEMEYLNQAFRTHGYYCIYNIPHHPLYKQIECDGWVKCDEECCGRRP